MSTQSQRERLRWRHRPLPELIRLAWPILVSLLSYSVMTLVDTLFVGQLGAAPLAALGLGGPVIFLVVSFGMATCSGAKVALAQALGAARHELVPGRVGAVMVLAAVIGVASLVVTQLLALALPTLSADREVGELASTYASVRSLAAPLVIVAAAISQVRLGLGDARSGMRAALVANLANVPLNALLIFGFGLGVAGAAWATVASRCVELAILVLIQRPRGFGLSAVRSADLRVVARLGLPVGIERTLDVAAFVAVVVLLARLSKEDVAAHQITLQFAHFSFLGMFALAEAASVMTGQAIGGDQDPLVQRIARLTGGVGLGYAAACSVVMLVFAGSVTQLFTTASDVQALASQVIYVAAVLQLLQAPYAVAKGVLRGTGDVRLVAMVTIAVAWVFTPPLTIALAFGLDLGAVGAWLALCVEVFAGNLLLWHRLSVRGWQPAAVRAREGMRLFGVHVAKN